ncbi:hypothetical protein M514_02380 [Trichuris suis]|uniref:Uncharacterized protein n=1 Tax=Trichuris suis TaxID=68888 RepID=A0A085MHK8_9BILA|nr:hypothetical protein M513_02380 [Trichuris suis]KFD60130.1 hypothetical protein M514_02380 [Trichuris suis]
MKNDAAAHRSMRWKPPRSLNILLDVHMTTSEDFMHESHFVQRKIRGSVHAMQPVDEQRQVADVSEAWTYLINRTGCCTINIPRLTTDNSHNIHWIFNEAGRCDRTSTVPTMCILPCAVTRECDSSDSSAVFLRCSVLFALRSLHRPLNCLPILLIKNVDFLTIVERVLMTLRDLHRKLRQIKKPNAWV